MVTSVRGLRSYFTIRCFATRWLHIIPYFPRPTSPVHSNELINSRASNNHSPPFSKFTPQGLAFDFVSFRYLHRENLNRSRSIIQNFHFYYSFVTQRTVHYGDDDCNDESALTEGIITERRSFRIIVSFLAIPSLIALGGRCSDAEQPE